MVNKKRNRKQKAKKSRALRSNREIKISDTSTSATAVSSTGFVTPLWSIQQGIAYNERIGLQVLPLKFQGEMLIRQSLSGSQRTSLRIIICCDLRQIDSTSPVLSDILSTNVTTAQLNYFNKGRFKIFYDKIVQVGPYNTTAKLNINLRGLLAMRWSGTGSSSIVQNGLYLLCLSDQSTNVPDIDYWFRLQYID